MEASRFSRIRATAFVGISLAIVFSLVRSANEQKSVGSFRGDILSEAFASDSSAVSETCGNLIVEGAEECDDGNATNTDSCTNTCTTAECGDSIVQSGVDECDDGNATNTDSCTNTCTTAECGDSIVQSGVDECDDGNATNTDSCTNACTTAECGDSIVQSGVDECDDGNATNTDSCTNTCTTAECGDSIIQSGVDECDDGNATNTDSCTNACTTAECGDGYVQTGVEACDDANASQLDACLNSCVAAACGDGYARTGVEECDDGNAVNTDSCANDCTSGSCGNGIVNVGEACDDGNAVNTDSCLSCAAATCGDGYVQTAVESCDDGNGLNTDSCTNSCGTATCGDGYVRSGVEQCDDGNQSTTDACVSCSTAYCGDHYVRANVEDCDGNTQSCTSQCREGGGSGGGDGGAGDDGGEGGDGGGGSSTGSESSVSCELVVVNSNTAQGVRYTHTKPAGTYSIKVFSPLNLNDAGYNPYTWKSWTVESLARVHGSSFYVMLNQTPVFGPSVDPNDSPGSTRVQTGPGIVYLDSTSFNPPGSQNHLLAANAARGVSTTMDLDPANPARNMQPDYLTFVVNAIGNRSGIGGYPGNDGNVYAQICLESLRPPSSTNNSSHNNSSASSGNSSMSESSAGGLKLHFDFNNVIGNTIEDMSGNNNRGVADGATAKDKCMYFDGIDDVITVPNLDMQAFTFAGWAKKENTLIGYTPPLLISKNDNGWGVGYIGAGASPTYLTQTGLSNVTSGDSAGINVFHHIAVTYANGMANFYIDGIYDSSEVYVKNFLSDGPYQLGLRAATKFKYVTAFHGWMDEIRVYDQLLNGSEIAALAAIEPDCLSSGDENSSAPQREQGDACPNGEQLVTKSTLLAATVADTPIQPGEMGEIYDATRTTISFTPEDRIYLMGYAPESQPFAQHITDDRLVLETTLPASVNIDYFSADCSQVAAGDDALDVTDLFRQTDKTVDTVNAKFWDICGTKKGHHPYYLVVEHCEAQTDSSAQSSREIGVDGTAICPDGSPEVVIDPKSKTGTRYNHALPSGEYLVEVYSPKGLSNDQYGNYSWRNWPAAPAGGSGPPAPGLCGAVGTNLLSNGSFETPTIVNPATNNDWALYDVQGGVNGPIPGWNPRVEGGPYQVELQRSGLLVTAAHGSQYAEVDAPGIVTLTQNVETTAGAYYDVNFAYIPRPDGGFQSIGVYWNGQLIKNISGVSGDSWNTCNVVRVQGTGGTDVLGFGSTGGVAGASNFIDNVSVVTVPDAPPPSNAGDIARHHGSSFLVAKNKSFTTAINGAGELRVDNADFTMDSLLVDPPDNQSATIVANDARGLAKTVTLTPGNYLNFIVESRHDLPANAYGAFENNRGAVHVRICNPTGFTSSRGSAGSTGSTGSTGSARSSMGSCSSTTSIASTTDFSTSPLGPVAGNIFENSDVRIESNNPSAILAIEPEVSPQGSLSGTPLLYVKNLNQRTDIITITPVDGPVDSIEFYVASALVSPQEYIAAYDENDVLIESIDMQGSTGFIKRMVSFPTNAPPGGAKIAYVDLMGISAIDDITIGTSRCVAGRNGSLSSATSTSSTSSRNDGYCCHDGAPIPSDRCFWMPVEGHSDICPDQLAIYTDQQTCLTECPGPCTPGTTCPNGLTCLSNGICPISPQGSSNGSNASAGSNASGNSNGSGGSNASNSSNGSTGSNTSNASGGSNASHGSANSNGSMGSNGSNTSGGSDGSRDSNGSRMFASRSFGSAGTQEMFNALVNRQARLLHCGNRQIDPFEECDDGNLNDADGCTAFCLRSDNSPCETDSSCDSGLCANNFCTRIGRCGDGVLEGYEECDEGDANNNVEPDSCRMSCRMSYAGDGVIDTGEQCDDGNLVNDDICDNKSIAYLCGDRIVNVTEDCDDGNRRSGDGCSASCMWEVLPESLIAGAHRGAGANYAGGVGGPFIGGVMDAQGQLQPTTITLPGSLIQQPIRTQSHGPVGETGPASLLFMAAGGAGGLAFMRRRKK